MRPGILPIVTEKIQESRALIRTLSRLFINPGNHQLVSRQTEGALLSSLCIVQYRPRSHYLYHRQQEEFRSWASRSREPKIGGFPTPGVKSPESQRRGALSLGVLGRAGAGRAECNVPYSSVPLLRSETLITHRRYRDIVLQRTSRQGDKSTELQ